MTTPLRQVRAVYDEATIRVYQAYSHAIADAALRAGRFAPPFSRTRMTWIKPSFLWMMYRAGWASKDDGQQRILAIDITRDGFEWALRNASTSQDPVLPDGSKPPVRVQWDPERDIHLHKLDHRSIQIGIGGAAVPRYVDSWTQRITDITERVHEIKHRLDHADAAGAEARLPVERVYPLPADIAARIG